MSKTIQLNYDEKEGKWVGIMEAEDNPPAKVEKAELEQAGVLAGITKMEFMDIPLGKAALGGGTALLASELIDAFIAPKDRWIRALGKGATIWGMNRFLKPWAGAEVVSAASLILAWDITRDLLPLDEWVSGLVARIRGLRTSSAGAPLQRANPGVQSRLLSSPQGAVAVPFATRQEALTQLD